MAMVTAAVHTAATIISDGMKTARGVEERRREMAAPSTRSTAELHAVSSLNAAYKFGSAP